MGLLRIALAQVNPTVGDLEGNSLIASRTILESRSLGADLVALPELVITGYPPEDLVLKPSFVNDNIAALNKIATETKGIAAIVGFMDSDENGVYNAAALIDDGEVKGVYRKHRLPNYGVFDEERYFEPGDRIVLGKIRDVVFGVTICEDVWSPAGPHVDCARAGARLVVNINGSPYHRGKGQERLSMLQDRATENRVAIAYVNMVGGQDELVFDGQSLAIDRNGNLAARAAQFEEELLVYEFKDEPEEGWTLTIEGGEAAPGAKWIDLGAGNPGPKPELEPRIASELDPVGEVYSALVLGVRDYLRKNDFDEAIVGVSGGIDSALTATIAADALGPVNVLAILNPSEFTSPQSTEDAEKLARNLGIEVRILPIDKAYHALIQTLEPVFKGTEWNIAEENLQSRIRGMMWMAISNKSEVTPRRKIVLSTGNKSEMGVGYATLYGDMAGGFGVLKDVPKTLVYDLARWRNHIREVIPQSIIDRAPSAELRPDQKDTDALPPYEVLDPILEAYVEDDKSYEEMVEMGFDPETVRDVIRLVDRAEYKRRQAPPGIKITEKAFGRDRRLPISNRYGKPRRGNH